MIFLLLVVALMLGIASIGTYCAKQQIEIEHYKKRIEELENIIDGSSMINKNE